jgi:anti-anti-sigma regulatory factor
MKQIHLFHRTQRMKLSFFKTGQMKSKTFNIRTSNNNSSKVQTIHLEGDLGINNSVAIKKSIAEMSFTGETVAIQIKNVERLDVTFLQILRALKTSLEKDGKKTDIISEIPKDIELLLLNTGFETTL